MRMTISPLLLALDVAKDGMIKMSSLALDAANEDDNAPIIVGTGCGRGQDSITHGGMVG